MITVTYTKAGASKVYEIPGDDPFAVMERARTKMFPVEQPAPPPPKSAQALAIEACRAALAKKKGLK